MGRAGRGFVLVFVATLGIVEHGQLVGACECVVPHRASDAIETADAIFTGVVERFEVIGTPSTEGDPYAQQLTYPARQATMRVQTVWKGIAASRVVVETPFDEPQCGYEFLVGKAYVVYAIGSDRLRTSSCERTRLVTTADDDLLALGEGAPMTADYQALITRCDVNEAAECCLASVQRMAAGHHQLAPPLGCPRGFQMKNLACHGSHHWCEPLDEVR